MTENNLGTALRLFASVFQKEVDQRLLDELCSRREELSNVLDGDALEGISVDSAEAALEALAVEYCQLFVGPRGHMTPVESIARGEERYWGPSTERVADFYTWAGFSMVNEMHLLPDHLSIELDCLASLEEADQNEEAATFARDHILQWLPALTKHVSTSATMAFYRVWTKALLTTLEELYGEES
jgi:TorA maturation chaperone TorD